MTNLPRISWALVLAAGIATALLVPFGAAHHPVQDDAPARDLFLVALTDKKAGLSASLSDSENASMSFDLQSSSTGPFCMDSSERCYPEVKLEAQNVGEDFQVRPDGVIDGRIHFAWTFQGSSPWPLYDYPGVVSLGLMVGGVEYCGPHFQLEGQGEDVNETFEFYRSQSSDEQKECYTYGDEPAGNETTNETPAQETWAHDVVLTLFIERGYGLGDEMFGYSELKVKVDTGGGTAVTLREIVEEAVALESPVPVADSESNATSQGNGTSDGFDPNFTPGPSTGLVVAALGGVAALAAVRRRP